MIVAYAAVGKDKNSEISKRGGRAPYYLIFEDGEFQEVAKNPVESGGGGAGPFVANMLANMGVEKFIAEEIGPNMAAALKENGMTFEEKSGKISDHI